MSVSECHYTHEEVKQTPSQLYKTAGKLCFGFHSAEAAVNRPSSQFYKYLAERGGT